MEVSERVPWFKTTGYRLQSCGRRVNNEDGQQHHGFELGSHAGRIRLHGRVDVSWNASRFLNCCRFAKVINIRSCNIVLLIQWGTCKRWGCYNTIVRTINYVLLFMLSKPHLFRVQSNTTRPSKLGFITARFMTFTGLNLSSSISFSVFPTFSHSSFS